MELDHLKVFIAEDEPEFRSNFIEDLLKFPKLQVGGVAEDGEQALSMLLSNDYDVAFLDIRLPKRSGIEVIQALQKAKPDPPKFVLITAYTDFFQAAFDVGAIDYLVKPFTNKRLKKTIERVREGSPHKAEKINPFGLACRVDGSIDIIKYDEIIYLKSKGNYIELAGKTREIRILGLLKNIEPRLPESQFVRIHRQTILNLSYLKSIELNFHNSYTATLKDSKTASLNIGRRYLNTLREKLNLR